VEFVVSGLFLESPVKLIVLMVVVNGLLILAWSTKRTRLTRRVLCGGGALTVILLVVQYIVVTPSEQVIALCHELADLTQEGDVRGIERHLADDFESIDLDRAGFIQRIERTLSRHHPEEARLRHFVFDMSDTGLAVVTFDVTCRIVTSEFSEQGVHVRWRLTFRRKGNVWRVTRIEALPTASLPINNLRDLLR